MQSKASSIDFMLQTCSFENTHLHPYPLPEGEGIFIYLCEPYLMMCYPNIPNSLLIAFHSSLSFTHCYGLLTPALVITAPLMTSPLMPRDSSVLPLKSKSTPPALPAGMIILASPFHITPSPGFRSTSFVSLSSILALNHVNSRAYSFSTTGSTFSFSTCG